MSETNDVIRQAASVAAQALAAQGSHDEVIALTKLAEYAALIKDIYAGKVSFIEGNRRLISLAQEANLLLDHDDLVTSPQRVEMVRQVLERLQNGEALPCIPTDIPALNRYLDGGLVKGVTLVGGRSGTGKSALMLQFAEHAAASGYRVMYISAEMDVLQLSWRSLARLTNISGGHIRSGQATSKEYERLQDALTEMGKWSITFKEKGSMGVEAIKAACVREQEHDGLDMVVIDYLGILKADKRQYENENQRLSSMSREIAAMALEMECVVLLGAQFSRAVERQKRRPMKSDFSGSGAIESDASVALGIHPHWDPDSEEDKPPVLDVDLCIVKNRHGPEGVHVTCLFDQGRCFRAFDSVSFTRDNGDPWLKNAQQEREEMWTDELPE